MANPRGIFTLRNLVLQKKLGEAVSDSEVFIATTTNETAGPNTGYTFGGYMPGPFPNPGTKSVCYKIDFSDDTIARVPGGDQPVASAGTASILPTYTAIYQMGGVQPASPYYTSNCFKMSYSSETNTNVPGGILSGIRYLGAHVYDGSSAGYTIGGGNSGFLSITDKTTYSSETTARVPSADLPRSNNRVGSVGSPTNGYIIGGNPTNSNITKFTYSSEAMANSPTQFTPGNTQGASGTSNTTTGYLQAGSVSTLFTKLSFSDDSISALPATYPVNNSGIGDPAASSDNDTHGYFALSSAPSADPSSQVFKLNFSTESVSTLSATIYASGLRQGRGGGGRSFSLPGQLRTTSVVKQFKTGVPQGPNNGYSTGGNIQTPTPQTSVSTVDKLDFATDTSSVTTALSTGSRNYGTGVSNTTTGYVCQGRADLTATDLSSVDKYTFSTDTSARGPSDTVLGNRSAGGFGNNDAGYLTGGNTPAESSATEKVTYSTDGIARVPSADLNQQAYWIAGFGNSDAGYAAGGWTPGSTSRIEKMSYVTETYSTLPTTLGGGPRGALSAVKYGASAFSNNDTGFISGGAPFPSANTHTSTDKFVFSTDTCSRLPGADLTAARAYLQGMNNSNVGYQPGGTTGTDHISTVEKMSFSTETYSINPGSNLSQGRYSMQTISGRMLDLPQQSSPTPTPQTFAVPNTTSPNVGHFGGGSPTSTVMNRINFSNDTGARIPTGDLTDAKQYFSASGSTTAGYFIGGWVGSYSSIVDKSTYSDSTTARVPTANTPDGMRGTASTSSSTAVYNGGGTYATGAPSAVSSVFKITFSSESPTLIPGGDLTAARRYMNEVGNPSTGYFLGGSPGPVTNTSKFTYSTETSSAIQDLAAGRGYAHGSGNLTAGYIQGGSNPPSTYISDVLKLSYSTDTITTLPSSADLSSGARHTTSSGNSTDSYTAGGSTTGAVNKSNVEKMSYSTETTSRVPGADLDTAVEGLASTSGVGDQLGSPTPVNC